MKTKHCCVALSGFASLFQCPSIRRRILRTSIWIIVQLQIDASVKHATINSGWGKYPHGDRLEGETFSWCSHGAHPLCLGDRRQHPQWHAKAPIHVAEQIAADMIVSGQVRMDVWELLCDCLPTGELHREASAKRSSSICSGAYSQGPLFGLRRNATVFPWVTLLICKYIRSCTHVPFTSLVLQRNILMSAHKTSSTLLIASMTCFHARHSVAVALGWRSELVTVHPRMVS